MERRPSSGTPQTTDATVSALIGVGATLDGGTVNWNVRLSAVYPTVEIRVCDSQLDPRSVITLALLIRALADADVDIATGARGSSARDAILRDAALGTLRASVSAVSSSTRTVDSSPPSARSTRSSTTPLRD